MISKTLTTAWLARCDHNNIGLSEKWYIPDDLSPDSGWEQARIPLSWNCTPEYEHYEGVFWYATEFSMPAKYRKDRHESLVRFLGVNYNCRAWLNGVPAGEHSGGFLPFDFVLPADSIKKKNKLIVRVDNTRSPRRIPGDNYDWFNYGGIVRDVILTIRDKAHFSSIRVSAKIKSASAAVVTIDFAQSIAFPFAWKILLGEEITAMGEIRPKKESGNFKVEIAHPKLWSPESPSIYLLEIEPLDSSLGDEASVRFGIREIKIDGAAILLNGKQIKIRGVSLHEELVPVGRSMTREERFRDVRDIKALGFNALRTSHYTHDEALLDAADESGLLVFEEIPVYWNLDYKNTAFRATADSMLREMISRDFNHPSILMWSVGNEVPVENPDCDSLMRSLMETARDLDPARPASYISCRFLIDETRKASDICCVNCYLGWYYGNEKHLATLLEATRTTAPDKPWIITEFGACAERGFRSEKHEKYSEDRQDEFISHYIRTINGLDWISGWFIWIYRDFRSPIRTHPRQSGFNRKGIVSETNEKKLIATRFPQLLEEKNASAVPVYVNKLVPYIKKLERLAYGAVFPFATEAQKKLYDSFFKNKPD